MSRGCLASLARVTFLAKGEEAPSSSISIKRHKTGFPNEFLTFLRIEDVVDEIENLPGRPTLGEHEQRPRNRELAAQRRFLIARNAVYSAFTLLLT